MPNIKMPSMKKRPSPDASSFVRLMEAMAACNMSGDEKDPWALVYKMAHTCFVSPTTGETACSHPEWEKEFWKNYDMARGYWETT